ncbi:MAG: T9SS type A sorting domain-containing protein [Bacteroidetes bacterium]|nr:T9SS type A sorting domain-containing protein [Bacteroidota bacterium]
MISPMARFLIISLLTLTVCRAQEWKQYTVSNSALPADLIYGLTVTPDGTLWAGTAAGLTSYNGVTWTTFDTVNSPLPDPYITALASDSTGTVWVGMGYAGVARVKNGVWTLFDSSNSGLPHNTIFDITIGPDGTPWFATDRGVANYNGTIWRNIAPIMVEPRSRALAFDRRGVLWMGTYDAPDFRGYMEYLKGDSLWFTILSKLDLISTHPWCMAAVDDSTMFVGTGNGLAKVVNGHWTIYHKQDSPLPANGIRSLSVTGNTVLIGTASGYVELTGDDWKVHQPSAGTLPNDVITRIVVDRNGNRWLATASSGLIVHRPGGIIADREQSRPNPNEFILQQNYPNPFNPSTTFTFTLPQSGHTSLRIYNAVGQEVATLVNESLDAGVGHRFRFNGGHLAGGVYVARLISGNRMQAVKMLLVK